MGQLNLYGATNRQLEHIVLTLYKVGPYEVFNFFWLVYDIDWLYGGKYQ